MVMMPRLHALDVRVTVRVAVVERVQMPQRVSPRLPPLTQGFHVTPNLNHKTFLH